MSVSFRKRLRNRSSSFKLTIPEQEEDNDPCLVLLVTPAPGLNTRYGNNTHIIGNHNRITIAWEHYPWTGHNTLKHENNTQISGTTPARITLAREHYPCAGHNTLTHGNNTHEQGTLSSSMDNIRMSREKSKTSAWMIINTAIIRLREQRP